MPSSSLVPVPRDELVRKAWGQYFEHDRIDIQIVRPEVAESWQRCRNLRVDPFHAPEAGIDGQNLKERLAIARNLIKIARPFMDNLFAFVRGTGFEVVLTDASGILLEVLGDKEILKRTRHIYLCQGGAWSEPMRGTNAIGMAISERRPAQIYAWEHYCQPHHFLTCSASPIFAPDGSMAGVLDMSGDYRSVSSHTLGMVVAAANAIESQLQLQMANGQLKTAHRYSNILLKNISDGLISINVNGIVTEINARGAEIFGVVPDLVKGQHIGKIPNAGEAVLPTLADADEHDSREFVLKRAGQEIACKASLMRGDNGELLGAVTVFHPIAKQPARLMTENPCHQYTFDDIVGNNAQMAALKQWASVAAASPFTVLLLGETGTGKELFAQAIHNGSSRRDGPFIAINCAALPESLIESELFGYEDGSFTGARKGGRPGKFEAASGGTIFLDEIGDMPLEMQTRLLRVIQEGKVARIGSVREIRVDVRIIAATHKDLKAEVKRDAFREDLYYRLSVLEVRIPPLRERVEDIPELTRQLVKRIARRFNRRLVAIDDDFLSKMQTYTWPGNVREMENLIEVAILRAGACGNLSADLLDLPGEIPSSTAPEPVPGTPAPGSASLRDSEKALIHKTLMFCKGNIRKTATKLGIGRNTLYRKIKEYNISRTTQISDIS